MAFACICALVVFVVLFVRKLYSPHLELGTIVLLTVATAVFCLAIAAFCEPALTTKTVEADRLTLAPLPNQLGEKPVFLIKNNEAGSFTYCAATDDGGCQMVSLWERNAPKGIYFHPLDEDVAPHIVIQKQGYTSIWSNIFAFPVDSTEYHFYIPRDGLITH